MKIIKSVFFLSLLMFLTGCGASSPKPVVKQKKIPAWVNSVLPNDNSQYMYGLGIAGNREGAINAALNDMISRLGTTIESSYESTQKVDGAYANLETTSNIKADVSKIKINNYRVIKSYKVNYREFAVMIEVDKQKFISGLKSELDVKKKSIREALKASKSMNAINRYNKKKELSKEAKSLLSTIYMLSELDKTFNKKKNLQFVFFINKTFMHEADRLQFFISGNLKSKKFVEKLRNFLAQKGFRVAPSKKNAVQIVVNVTDNISDDYVAIAVLTLNISVFDGRKQVGGKSLILKERYNGSMQNVYKNASIEFGEDIKSKGIDSVVGIDLKL